MPAWLQTFTGGQNFALDPESTQIRIEDIAHHCAMKCRFNGAPYEFYSVAEHCIHVADLLRARPRAEQLRGLLHDACEAYMGDVASPILDSPEATFLRALETRWLKRIGEALNVPGLEERTPEIHRADMAMLLSEARALLPPHPYWTDLAEKTGIQPGPHYLVSTWTPREAETRFLREYRRLRG